jgi:glycosyltransferase involved in cell wall biosynthesis
VDATDSGDGRVTWHSVNLLNAFLPRLEKYIRYARQLSRDFHPDIIWACSDAYHGIFGVWLAKQIRTQCVIDLYDNYESIKATRVPGVLPRFRRAVRNADGVTCVSHLLANFIGSKYGRKEPILVLHNAARTDLFYSRDQRTCRTQLGLPEQNIIIGAAGALDKSRGVDTLFRAFKFLTKKNPSIHLALAGPRSRFRKIPTGPMIHDLGTLPLDKVPVLLNALDVAVICNRDSAFGRYCFPQKAYEIIACRVPLVAAAVGSMNELLAEYPQCLYEPENSNSLTRAIERQLEARTLVNLPAPSWADSAKKLEAFFQDVLRDSKLSGGTSPGGSIAG